MKKKKVIIISIIILIIIICLGVYVIKIFNERKLKSNLEYEIIREGYSDIESRIVSSYDEYNKLIKETESDYYENKKHDSNKYDENFFENKSIAIINIITGSSMNKLQKINLSTKGNTLICDAIIKEPDSMYITDDENGLVILVEVDKNITKYKLNKEYK